METRGFVAEWDDTRGHLTVWGSTKVLWYNRAAIAKALGLAPEQVDLIGTEVGGGFGVRGELYPEDFLVPFVARALKRPVKWIEDRREHLMATNHSREIACDLEIACMRDGRIAGLRGTFYADMGAYTRTNGGVVPAKAAQFVLGPYRIPNVAFDVAIYPHQQDAGRHLSRARPLRGEFLPRIAARHCGVRPWYRRRGIPPHQSHPRRRAAVFHRPSRAVRKALGL